MRKMQGGECDNNGRRGTQRTVLARYLEIDIYVVIFNLRILTSINAISALILYYFKPLKTSDCISASLTHYGYCVNKNYP